MSGAAKSAVPKTDQDTWVKRVLGVAIDAPAAADGAGGIDTRAWTAARSKLAQANARADAMIDAVRGAMRRNPALAPYAAFTLDGTDTAFKTMLAALPEQPPATGTASQAARSAIALFKSALSADQVVQACDDNPLGVRSSIERVFTQALAPLTAMLSAV